MRDTRTPAEILRALQIVPSPPPRLYHLGHSWLQHAPHRYQCRFCAARACDPDAVLLTCDELLAERTGRRVQRNAPLHNARSQRRIGGGF